MLHCFQCGADLPDNLAYCLHCGAALNDDTPTVVHPMPEPVPVEPQPRQGSGALKFILGSLIGAIAVVVLLVVGAFVLFSMRDDDHPANISVNNNANLSSPTPSKSPTPKKPTPTPTPSSANENTERVNVKTCTVVNPAGGSVNLRRNCDTRDCSMDASTLYTQLDPGDTVEATNRKPVTTGRFTWVAVKYHGETLWISSTRVDCDTP